MSEKALENRRQNITIALCWLVYTSAYFGRYSFNSNIAFIIEDYGISHAQAGLVATFFFFAYGSFQIIHGMLCDKYSKRLMLPVALWVSAALNIILFFGVNFGYIKYMWLFNGIVQSMLWPCIMLVLGQNLDKKHMKRAIVIIGTTTSAGTFATYGLNSVFAFMGRYRLSFISGAVIMSVIGLAWLLLFRPADADMSKEEQTEEQSQSGGKLSHSIVFMIAVFCFFSVACNFVKDGTHTWVPSILKETYAISDGLSLSLTTVINVLGLFGAMTAIGLNKFIKNYMSLTSMFFGVSALAVGLILGILNISLWVVFVLFGLVVLVMHAICNLLTSIIPLMMRGSVNPGKISGLINGCGYLGSTISTYTLGWFADKYGWSMVFLLFISVCAVMSVISIVIRLFTGRLYTRAD